MWVCQGCRCLKALAEMVIIVEMPFRSVEGEGFKRYSKVLQPRFEVPSRITVARDCMQRYVEEKTHVKEASKESQNLHNNRYLDLQAKFILYGSHYTMD
ncbi:hypothetical protein PVAP13_8KG120301 [Panicum virgatum]|uniref:Uncharacterized protein n=1 Tax=Panicum virgatum TaxID=38727 RepID=A0A8T0PT76_PANVG|nr:hypothetical protein PVAP13_8KG120301 [Panicum virgatum]